MSRLVEFDLKSKIYGHYQTLDATFYKANDTGDLMNRPAKTSATFGCTSSSHHVFIELAGFGVHGGGRDVVHRPHIDIVRLAPRHLFHLCKHSQEKRRQTTCSERFVSSFNSTSLEQGTQKHREHAAAERFDAETGLYKMRVLDLVKVEAMFMPLIVLLVGLNAILRHVGGLRVDGGQLALGDIFEFVFYVNLLTWPSPLSAGDVPCAESRSFDGSDFGF